MALRSTTNKHEPNFGEVLDDLEARMERLKRLYEQYFLGIQKIPPAQLHQEVTRVIRELTQKQPRNTALRYRFTNISQRFGAYSTYWNRVLRQIEQGTYIRDLARVKRRADRRGEQIPDDVLAKMPAMMRKRVLRERERVIRRQADLGDHAAGEPARAGAPDRAGPPVHHIDETDPLLGGDLDTDMETLFSSIMAEDAPLGSDGPVARAASPASGGPEVTEESARSGPEGTWHEPAAASQRAPARPRAAIGSGSGIAGEGAWRERGRSRPGERPEAPAAKSAGPGKIARATSGALPPGMDEPQARALYDKYTRARKMVGASSEVSFGRLMSSLRSQAPRIMEQHRAEGVEFNVVLKDNRVVVKATPKK